MLPLRVRRERRLPADSSSPGRIAAQLAAGRLYGKRLMSGPSWVRMASLLRVATPVVVVSSSALRAKRCQALLDILSQRGFASPR